MVIATARDISDRLLVIETFLSDPPDSDFQRGYLTALMDEASEDMEDAASDIFNKALDLVGSVARQNYIRRRAITLR